MLVYISVFLGMAAFCIYTRSRLSSYSWLIVSIFLVLFIGLRHDVGGDWANYLNICNAIDYGRLWVYLMDPSYGLLNFIANSTGTCPYLVNIVCSIIFVYYYVKFCRSTARPGLALIAGYPYLVVVVAMGYTRQSVAIALSLGALLDLEKGDSLRAAFLVGIAATFHTSAIAVMPLVVLTKRVAGHWKLILLITSCLSVVLLIVMYLKATASYYFTDAYTSQISYGVLPRLSMTAVSAVIFLRNIKSLSFGSPLKARLWSTISLASLLLLLLSAIVPYGVVLDRLGLYLIPLQLYVCGNISYAACGGIGFRSKTWIIVFSYFAVLLTWLIFAVNAIGWLPYTNYLLLL